MSKTSSRPVGARAAVRPAEPPSLAGDPPDARARTLRAPNLYRLACAIVLLAVWAALGATLYSSRMQEVEQRNNLAASTAKGFSEYVGLHLLFVDRMLQNARIGFLRTGTVPGHEQLVKELGQMAPMLLQMAATDATGLAKASSLPLAPNITIADRPHFLAFKNDPSDRLYVSQPVVGRVSGKMSLQLVRPILGPDGEFAGVIVASIDPLLLQQYFSSFDAFTDEGSVVIAGRDDGVVRARFTKRDITWGQSLRTSVAWQALSSERAGMYQGAGAIGGQPRIAGFHQVAAYPLVVVVSWRLDPWYRLDRGLLAASIIAAAFSVLMILLTMVMVRRDDEQQAVIRQLRSSREREMEANQLKSSFLASVSHELRTPLNSILGFSELIRDTGADGATRKYASLIHDGARHLHALVNTLLDMARIEAGRMEVERQRVELASLVRNLADAHAVSAQRKGLGLATRMDLPDDAEVFAVTDRTKLTQVFNNVLNNAVKFTETGAIQVDCTMDQSSFLIRITDTGPGIEPDRLATLFQRFAPRAALAKQEGSGLGLALSHELMTLLGGSIQLRSHPGRGTEVEIRVPSAEVVHKEPA